MNLGLLNLMGYLTPSQRRAAEKRIEAIRRQQTNKMAAPPKPKPKEPLMRHITVHLGDTRGSAVTLVGKVRRELDRHRVHDDIVESFVREALSGNHLHTLDTIRKWVNIT